MMSRTMIYLLHLDYLVSVLIGSDAWRDFDDLINSTRNLGTYERVENMWVGRGVCQSVCLANDAKWSCDGSRVGGCRIARERYFIRTSRRRTSTLLVAVLISRILPTFAIITVSDRTKDYILFLSSNTESNRFKINLVQWFC